MAYFKLLLQSFGCFNNLEEKAHIMWPIGRMFTWVVEYLGSIPVKEHWSLFSYLISDANLSIYKNVLAQWCKHLLDAPSVIDQSPSANHQGFINKNISDMKSTLISRLTALLNK